MRDAILPRLRSTLWGRLIVLAVATKVLVAVAALAVEPPFLLSLLDALASTTLVVVGLYGVVKLFGVASRKMLWRVRRKLILSYVFIGLVPALLIAVFFVGAGLLTFLNLSSYLLQRGVDDLIEHAEILATDLAIELAEVSNPEDAQRILESHQAATSTRLSDVSFAVVPTVWGTETTTVSQGGSVGPWWHLEPPRELPTWVSRGGLGGLLAYISPDSEETALTFRAAGMPDERDPAFAVIVDVPLDDDVAEQIREDTPVSRSGRSP